MFIEFRARLIKDISHLVNNEELLQNPTNPSFRYKFEYCNNCTAPQFYNLPEMQNTALQQISPNQDIKKTYKPKPDEDSFTGDQSINGSSMAALHHTIQSKH